MLSLLFTVLVLGVIAWVLGQFPIPAPFKAVFYGILVIMLLIVLFQALGAGVSFPVLR